MFAEVGERARVGDERPLEPFDESAHDRGRIRGESKTRADTDGVRVIRQIEERFDCCLDVALVVGYDDLFHEMRPQCRGRAFPAATVT